jgi:multicomponent Na+:H+ antiporter subunit B
MIGMSKIVKSFANILFPLITIYGLYVIAHGHLTPGGGFQGGAIVASGCALLLIAHGSPWIFKKIKEGNLSVLESLGALSFITLAFIGIFTGFAFFSNFLVGTNLLFGTVPTSGAADINTGGTLPLMNFAVGLKVIAGLFVIVLLMAFATTQKKEEDA